MMIIKLRVALTLVGLVAILLAIHFLTSGLGQSGRIRIPAGRNEPAQASAALSGSNAALPAKPGESEYGLQVGHYSNRSDAQAMAARVDGAVFSIVDSGGNNWWVVVVGPFSSAKDAQKHSSTVAGRLNVPAASMSVIKWPQTPQ
jgi:hypothetical protein